jgi:hypothetical protein
VTPYGYKIDHTGIHTAEYQISNWHNFTIKNSKYQKIHTNILLC